MDAMARADRRSNDPIGRFRACLRRRTGVALEVKSRGARTSGVAPALGAAPKSRPTDGGNIAHSIVKRRPSPATNRYFGARVFEETADMIPNARLTLFERETHMLPIEKSGIVASSIAAFVAGSSSHSRRVAA